MINVNLTDNEKYQYNPPVDALHSGECSVISVVTNPKVILENTSDKPKFGGIYEIIGQYYSSISGPWKSDIFLIEEY